MADVCASHPEDDISGDVGGVIGDSLETARDEDSAERLDGDVGGSLDDSDETFAGDAVHAVDFIIHGEYCVGDESVGVEQRLDGRADHPRGDLAHAVDVDREVSVLVLEQIESTAGDPHRLVADAFEVTINFDDREDETQIDGHGLLFSKEFVSHFVDFAMGHVDRGLIVADVLAEPGIALQVGVDSRLNTLLRERSHGEQLVFESVELLVKMYSRQSLLPYSMQDGAPSILIVRL